MPIFKKSETEIPKTASGSVPSGSTDQGLGTRSRGVVRSSDRNASSVIGPDLTIIGNLVSKGEVQIDGEVQGDIQGTYVVIGEKARITGGIVAEKVVVRGHVMGSVRGKHVMLQSSSHLQGDIFYQTLAMEQGALFDGMSRRTEDPTAGVQKPEIPALNGTSSNDQDTSL